MSPQSSFTPPTDGRPGQLAIDRMLCEIDTYEYREPVQISTLLFGGTSETGTYTVVVDDGNGNTWEFEFEASTSTPAQIAAGIKAAMVADATFEDVIANATVNSATVTLTFLDSGAAYTITAPSPPDTVTIATTQDPVQGILPIGRFVTAPSERVVRLPVNADTFGMIAGVTVRSDGEMLGHTVPPQTDDGYRAPAMVVPVLSKGDVWVYCETDCAFKGTVFVRKTDGVLGVARKDTDSGDAMAIRAEFRKTLSAAGMTIVRLALPSISAIP